MRKILTLAFLLALLASPSSGNPDPAATGGEQASDAREVVLSASEIDYPPFCLVKPDGSPDGFSVELLRAALAAVDREVTLRTGTWPEVRGWLERGEVAALPLVGRTPEREGLFDFTFPYMTMHGAIVVRRGTSGIHGLADLAGRTVAVMQGDNAEEYLRRQDIDLTIRTTSSFQEALRELAEGRHDAVVSQRLVALRLIAQAGLEGLEIVPRPLEDFRQDFCFAVKEGDRETLAMLNEGLALVMADGTFRHLHHKWFAALELPSDRPILVGGDRDYPPYEYLDEIGRPTGFNVDLTRAIARQVGVEVDIRLGPWPEITSALLDGRVDVVQGMFYSPARDLSFDLSQPHLVNSCVAVVRRQGPVRPPEDPRGLQGLRIVAETGDIMHDFALDHGLQQGLTTVESQGKALQEVVGGRQDVALVSRLTALYWIEKEGWTDLEIGRRPLLSPDYCFAVRNGNKALLAQFGEGLKALEESGEYRRIREKWLGVYREDHLLTPELLRRAALGLGALLAVLLVVLAWSWSLRRQVAARTEDLRTREEYLRSLIACSPVALYSIDTGGRVQTWNSSAERVFGWSDTEILGRPLPIVPEDYQAEYMEYRRQLQAGQGFLGREVVRLRKDGSRFTGRLSTAPLLDGAGAMIGVMGAMEDISLEKAADERIRHLNRVLLALRAVSRLIREARDPQTLIQEAGARLVEYGSYDGVLIILTGPEGRPETWAENGLGPCPGALEQLEAGVLPGCCRALVSEKETVVIPGCSPDAGTADGPGACGGPSAALGIRLILDGIPRGYLIASLPPGFGPDGEERQLFAEMAAELCLGLGAMGDRLARRNAEQDREAMQRQLLQAQKMEAVGQLAGGVAHDFNNILQAIMGYTQILIEERPAGSPVPEELAEIFKGAERAASLTRQLLAFSRRQVMQPESLDLNALIDNLLKMLRRLIGEHLRLEWLPGNNLGAVYADAGMIEQVVVNLCVNARDAMAGGGTLIIETQNVLIDSDYCESHAWAQPGRYVLLSVTDTGCGIPAPDLQRIFEPFYTTKEEGRGTGLGLATVYGIVKQHEGMVNAYSEVGKGTTVKVYLPISQQKATAVGPLIEGGVRGGAETILLAEDDQAVRNLAQTILTRSGYRVLTAGDGEEAVQVFAAHAGEVDLLILDVVMPRAGGQEAHRRCQEIRSGVPVLFCSGYSPNAVHTNFVLHEGLHLVQKPYSQASLLRAVRGALDGKAEVL
ncbi:MAG: transporter substrate-binding domain-containing protein [bacterium]